MLIIFLLFSADFCLGETDNSDWSFDFYFDNDFYYKTDKYYTNGLRLSLTSPCLEQIDSNHFIYNYMKYIDNSLGFLHGDGSDAERNFVFFTGQDIYTPSRKDEAEVVADDRPYAGWLYVGIGYGCRRETKSDSLKLSLGIIGPDSFAEDVQNQFHDFNGDSRSAGWNNQLSNELGFILNYERKQKLLGSSIEDFDYDAIGHIGGSFGNVYTYANFGIELRAGYNLEPDFGSASWQNSFPTDIPRNRFEKSSRVAAHCFAAMDGRAVARNIFLDGNTFTDSHEVEKKTFVADFLIGFSLTYQKYKISFTHTYRSKEFMEQTDPHRFGTVSFSFLF